MRRRKIRLAVLAGLIAAVVITAAVRTGESQPDVSGVNDGYIDLFRELERSWSIEQPIAVPPDPNTLDGARVPVKQ